MASIGDSTRTYMPPQPKETKKKTEPSVTAKRWLSRVPTQLKTPWVLVGVLVVFSVFMIWQYNQAKHKVQSATPAAASKQLNDVVRKVSKIAILPSNETPTIATVVHADKLHSQSFFANAKDGDRVLVYSQQKRAILYRPNTDQIVTIAPVTVAPNGTPTITNQ